MNKYYRGDIMIEVGGAERVYLRMEHYWTVSPNSSNWYPTDEAMAAKENSGEVIFIGNRDDYL